MRSKIPRKFELIAVRGHPRSSTLVPLEKSICNFLLVISSDIGSISDRFRDTEACLFTPPLFDAPAQGELARIYGLNLYRKKLEELGYSVVKVA